MKIAVCLSGQPRTLRYASKSIINYFSGDYEVDYFCHSWNYNNWKGKTDQITWSNDEVVDKEQLLTDLSVFNPKKVEIQSKDSVRCHGPWESLFYSMMKANFLKKEYEIHNNFRYDLVIRARYDTIYQPNTNFVPPHPENNLDLYITHCERMNIEYNRLNVSDVFFFGTSFGMDIVCDVYRYVVDINNARRLDDFATLGPGVIIGEYCNRYNIAVKHHGVQEIIYRKEMMPLDPIINFDEVLNNHIRYYA